MPSSSRRRRADEPDGALRALDRTVVTRLWDKGGSLDARVLEYTAGDDHLLDNRLVAYDIRASIAHAEMLGDQGLISPDEIEVIRAALSAIGAEHARGAWRVTLEQ